MVLQSLVLVLLEMMLVKSRKTIILESSETNIVVFFIQLLEYLLKE